MQSIFVISDLHLGGKPGFQMCSPQGRDNLSAFIRWVIEQCAAEREVCLVIAGDIVDFLAEEDFNAFTADESAACRKLEHVFQNYEPVWSALKDFVASGAPLKLLLGNHDVELSLPAPYRLLRERLGEGSVEFIYDNQAFVRGPLLIEHGNRYDEWNVVPHDELRRVRSALSRRESSPPFTALPGSQLVVRVMNKLKKDYGFIDLLKPENQAMLPLLAVLNPSAIGEIREVVALARKARQVKFKPDGAPLSAGLISADNTGKMLRKAEELAGVAAAAAGMIGAANYVTTLQAFGDIWRATQAQDKVEQINRLYSALRIFAAEQHKAFATDREDETYLNPARTLAKRGYRVVVFGHTHLVKQVEIEGAPLGSLYLNSGTWADIIRLPASLFEPDERKAKNELAVFADDLANNHLENWRTQIPTFVRIDLDGEHLVGAGAYYFRGAGSVMAV